MRFITYTTRPESADENAALVRASYAELEAAGLDGVHYMTLRLDDGVTFVHLYDGPQDALRQLDAFEAFRTTLADRCDAPPEFHAAEVVGEHELLVT